MTRRIATQLAAAAALAGALALPGAAQAAAGSVSVDDYGSSKQIRYEGSADANAVDFGGSVADRIVTVTEEGIADPSAGSDPGNDCDLTAPDTLTCKDPELEQGNIAGGVAQLGEGDDVTVVTGTIRWLVYAGAGGDSLTGSEAAPDHLSGGAGGDTIDGRGDSSGSVRFEFIDGEAGDDVLRGGAGREIISGGDGNDDLDGADGDDFLDGGGGVDVVRGGDGDDGLNTGEGEGELAEGGDGSDRLACRGDANEVYDGGPGLDTVDCYGGVDEGDPDDYVIDLGAGVVRRTNHVPALATLSSIEDASSSDGSDVLIGTDGANSLQGGGGADQIDGRGGSDHVWGEDGSDTLVTDDGKPDRASGGSDHDTCRGDEVDELDACEAFTLAPVGAPGGGPTGPGPTTDPADRSAPSCTITRARADRARGRITFNTTCNETATLAAEAVGRLRRLPRGALASRAGDVTLGSAAAKVTAGGQARVTLRLSRAYRRALPKRGRIRLVLRATDELGHQSALSLTLRLR